MTLKIESPVTKIAAPQVQSQIQAEKPQIAPVQTQAQKTPQISKTKVQVVQKPATQSKNPTTLLQTPTVNKPLIKKPENPSVLSQIVKTPVVTTPPRPIEEKNLIQTTAKTLEKPITIKPQQAEVFVSVEKNFKSLFT